MKIVEPIDAAPFLDWCDRRIAAIRADWDNCPGINGGVDINAVERLVQHLGWDVESGVRRLHRWRHENATGQVERAAVEDALHHAGVRLDEIYPDLAADPGEVSTGYCRTCCEDVIVTDSRCPWCGGGVEAQRPKGSTSRVGQGRLMTDEQVRAAHVIYERTGKSIRQLGDILWERYGYANADSCAWQLRRAFIRLGLPRRDAKAASLAAHLTHGLTRNGHHPPEYVAMRRERKRARFGSCQACGRVAREGTDFCGYHQPDEIARRRAQVDEINARRAERAA